MEIRLPIKLLDKAIEATSHVELIRAKNEMQRIGTSVARTAVIIGTKLDKKTLKFLYEETKDKDTGAANSIEFLWKATKNPSRLMVKSMKEIGPALQAYLTSGGIKNYLFERGSNKTLNPYVVTEIKIDDGKSAYRRHNARYPIMNVSVSLAFDSGDQLEHTSLAFTPSTLISIFEDNNVEYEEKTHTEKAGTDDEYTYTYDAISDTGVSVEAFTRYYDKFLETAELHELLEKQHARYLAYVKQYGAQFRVRGVGDAVQQSWYSVSEAQMNVEGKPGRCIMNTIPAALIKKDETDEQPVKSRHKSRGYFGNRYRERESEDDVENTNLSNDPLEIKAAFDALDFTQIQITTQSMIVNPKEPEEVVAPLHPKLKVFHLTKMEDYWVHVNNLLPYKYKDDLIDKLILEDEVKELVQMLVVGSADESEDVIEGKTQSTIIGAVGDPGLGKTLMCEVMSEACQKPLYKVQAAQLGLTPEELEKNLQRILMKAQRWNAILMIDEANAYIHSRGHDIKQNAIVGVFLRLLDYYKGILVLTTNMTNNADDAALDFDIDAAIVSRCTAVIHFSLPTPELAAELWKLQAELRGITLDDELLDKLVKRFQLSGRTIRNLLKMASNWADHKKEELTLEHFKMAARFVPMSGQEKKTLIRDKR